MFCGDFNTILLTEDRLYGNHVTASVITDFTDFMRTNSLYQVKTVGSYYTWCSNQYADDRVHTIIDRCIPNQELFDTFTNVIAETLEKGVTDHTLILLHFDVASSVPTRTFKFLNVLTMYRGCNFPTRGLFPLRVLRF